MSFIGNLLLGIIASYVSWLLTPKPQPPKAGTLEDFNIPRVDEGTEIGIAHGSPWIKSSHVVWFGDFRSVPIKESQGKK